VGVVHTDGRAKWTQPASASVPRAHSNQPAVVQMPTDPSFRPETTAPGHIPVLLREAIAYLAPRPGGVYVDATFGGGGHTRKILEASAPDGRVLALDADPEAVRRAERLIADQDLGDRLRIVHANFAHLGDVLRDAVVGTVDGALFDLGLSSFQLDDAGRGFSFRAAGPIDMRLDPGEGAPVAEMVNTLPEDELAAIIFEYGEEPKSRRIARAIVRERERAPITRTDILADIVAYAVGGRRGADTHPATRTFQALRIARNRELSALADGLHAALDALAPGGRLVTIAFHSLEDRIVKQFIAAESATCVCPPDLPVCVCDQQPRLRKVTGKAVRPGADEITANPRARSAVLRAAERLPIESGAERRTR
jgi:16S rRNA (cytosine1402-N4)-methyltransferase